MKEIDEIPPFNPNKLFETPQKKHNTLKKCSDRKGISPSHLDPKQKFDLGQSPRFKASTDIRIDQQQSSAKQPPFESVKKQYSPAIVVKIEESPYSSVEMFLSSKKQRNVVRESCGNLSTKENFKRCYTKLIGKIGENLLIEIPEPEIIEPESEDENNYSQLVNFPLNEKNSRKLVYDDEKKTLVPIYQCLGCKTDFYNSPALGGHLRSCPYKFAHYKMLNMYLKSCQWGQSSSESFERMKSYGNDIMKQKVLKEEYFKTPEKIPKIDDKKINNITQKQKDNHSIFCSSEEKSISKSVQGSEKRYDEKYENLYKIESEQDEGYREDSQEYNPKQEKTVKKHRGVNTRKESSEKTKNKYIRKN